VGAPKCGTTALFQYLSTHPNVFLPVFKEPHHFATDFPESRKFVRSPEKYLELFKNAKPQQTAIGEASVLYLYSKTAIKNIHEFDPGARLIAMVRNPVDMIYSYFMVNRFHFDEDQEDFEAAWRLQGARRAGESVPASCIDPSLLMYGDIARMGEQIQRMLEIFPREQVKIIVFDDFIADTRRVYLDVLEFLGVPDDGKESFPRVNENKVHRFPSAARLLFRPSGWAAPFVNLMKRSVGARRQQVAAVVARAIMKPAPRVPLREEFRRELYDYFREDVALLSRILDRDLSRWVSGS
jgi:hypothetical protein